MSHTRLERAALQLDGQSGTIDLERLKTRYFIDPASGEPHIHDHAVTEDEVMEILDWPEEDRPGREGARVAVGQTSAGPYLRVIYVPEPESDSIFVITAYDLTRKAVVAFRRRRKKKQQ